MGIRNQIEDALSALDVEVQLIADLEAIVEDMEGTPPSQLLLKFAGYTPQLFEDFGSRNRGVIANLARLVLIP
jgi:hypothetical protein